MSNTNPRVLVITSEDNRTSELFCTRDVQGQTRAETGKLVFNRYGNQYFLSELWLQGELKGSQLVKTEQEEVLASKAGAIKKRGRVTVKITEVKPN